MLALDVEQHMFVQRFVMHAVLWAAQSPALAQDMAPSQALPWVSAPESLAIASDPLLLPLLSIPLLLPLLSTPLLLALPSSPLEPEPSTPELEPSSPASCVASVLASVDELAPLPLLLPQP
jgi:hypothetical protein